MRLVSFTVAVRRINAEFCEDKLAELDQQLKGLVDTHRHHVEAMTNIKLNFEENWKKMTSVYTSAQRSISAQRETIATPEETSPLYQKSIQSIQSKQNFWGASENLIQQLRYAEEGISLCVRGHKMR